MIENQETDDLEDLNQHLTEEQRKIVEKALTGYGEQGANGYDLSMFRENLRRTPTERIQRLQLAHNFFVEVKNARANRVSKSNKADDG